MNWRESRLLNPKLIPDSLWDTENAILLLPPSLVKAYVTLIKRHDLQGLADSRDSKNPPTGGLTQEKTDEHFAQAFDGSVARAQLALLDPKCHAELSSNAYIRSLAGNKLSLTDAPCGAGAAAFSFLANIAELRAKGVLPRQPLDVCLIGAELSAPARVYAQSLLEELCIELEKQAIFVEAEFISWDVTEQLSNTDVIKKMICASVTHPRRLLIVANFNGLLERDRKKKLAEPQFNELFRHASGKNSVALWIEPDMNRATSNGGLFHWLRANIKNVWSKFIQETSDSNEPILTSTAEFQLPLTLSETATVRLALMPLSLGRTK
ncbi:conserved hypothetical protein [Crenothrix polyspora]|uniref:Uncharacterized protein n=1 Tax=Crenothrix polyspora TaxID=360316 RepID=A0A1R4H5L5_9GAMM|nr:hypothetical protein [Crenothrix polyspora]SJM91552.1 conserved hypothetical protein [Crenothrix polyspora]